MMDLYEELEEDPKLAPSMEKDNNANIAAAESRIDSLIAEENYVEVQSWIERLSLYMRLAEKLRNVQESGA